MLEVYIAWTKTELKCGKCGNSYTEIICRSATLTVAYFHTQQLASTRKFSSLRCKIVYLQHGGVCYYWHNDVTVISCVPASHSPTSSQVPGCSTLPRRRGGAEVRTNRCGRADRPAVVCPPPGVTPQIIPPNDDDCDGNTGRWRTGPGCPSRRACAAANFIKTTGTGETPPPQR